SKAARVLAVAMIWGPAFWGLFTFRLRFDGWFRRHRVAVAIVVACVAAGLTTWELLVGPQASDVATSRLLVETWVTFMLVWAINNVLHCRLAAAGDDAKGLTWLVTASAFFVGAGVAYVPQFDTPTIWSVFASEACLAVGGVSILLALARYGAGVPPFTYPGASPASAQCGRGPSERIGLRDARCVRVSTVDSPGSGSVGHLRRCDHDPFVE